MVWAASETGKLSETSAAAEYSPLPGCVAWMVQEPAARSDASAPETVQMVGVTERS
jgi:hypothetical protein